MCQQDNASEQLRTCPVCKGKGYFSGFISADVGHYFGKPDCHRCFATGNVSEADFQCWEFGQGMRLDRVQRGLSTRQEAKRLKLPWGVYLLLEGGTVSAHRNRADIIEQRRAEMNL